MPLLNRETRSVPVRVKLRRRRVGGVVQLVEYRYTTCIICTCTWGNAHGRALLYNDIVSCYISSSGLDIDK